MSLCSFHTNCYPEASPVILWEGESFLLEYTQVHCILQFIVGQILINNLCEQIVPFPHHLLGETMMLSNALNMNYWHLCGTIAFTVSLKHAKSLRKYSMNYLLFAPPVKDHVLCRCIRVWYNLTYIYINNVLRTGETYLSKGELFSNLPEGCICPFGFPDKSASLSWHFWGGDARDVGPYDWLSGSCGQLSPLVWFRSVIPQLLLFFAHAP